MYDYYPIICAVLIYCIPSQLQCLHYDAPGGAGFIPIHLSTFVYLKFIEQVSVPGRGAEIKAAFMLSGCPKGGDMYWEQVVPGGREI